MSRSPIRRPVRPLVRGIAHALAGLACCAALVVPTLARAEALPLWRIPLETLGETRNRPPFSPSRRPPASAPAASAALPGLAAASRQDIGLTLLGVLRGPEGSGIAVLRSTSGDEVVRLHVGESHAGWRLAALRRGEALFERDDTTVLLTLPRLDAGQADGAGASGQAAPGQGASSPGGLENEGNLPLTTAPLPPVPVER